MQERGNLILKKIDRYIGIPLVFALGLLSKKNLTWRKPIVKKKSFRVLFLKTGAVGDSILLSAIALEIKNHWNRAHITLLCTKSNIGVVPLLAGIDDSILFPIEKGVVSFFRARRYGPFDLLIDFAAWPRLNSLIAFFVPAKFRIGFRRQGQYRHFIYDRYVTHDDKLHELDNYRKLLEPIGIQATGITPQIRVKELQQKLKLVFSQSKLLSKLVQKRTKIILFHTFPGGTKKEFKMWPDKNWQELGQSLLERGYTICFSGARSEKKKAEELCQLIQVDRKGKVFNLAGSLSWEETACLLQKVKMLVSVNTGIMHLAAALGTKVTALNGPTNVARWGAVSSKDNVKNFCSTYECSPCLSLGFEYACKAGGCMTTIQPKSVLRAIQLRC